MHGEERTVHCIHRRGPEPDGSLRRGRGSCRRRLVLLLIASLLAGAAATVAIAWAAALRPERFNVVKMFGQAEAWPAPVPDSWGAPGLENVMAQWGRVRTSTGNPDSQVITEDECGWPMRSLHGWTLRWAADDGQPAGYFEGFEETVFVREPHFLLHWRNRPLPLRPMWPGFLLNTLLFASLVFALLAAPRLIRTLARRRRGGCLRCGYDLRGLTDGVCPECGSGG